MTGDRTRVYVDENLPHQVAPALMAAFRSTIFSSHKDEGLTGVLDLPLFEVLRKRKFNVIVTRDIAQSMTAAERDGLRAAGLHWVGVREPRSARGIHFHSAIVSAIAASVPVITRDVGAAPRAFFVQCEHLQWTNPIASELL